MKREVGTTIGMNTDTFQFQAQKYVLYTSPVQRWYITPDARN